MPHEPSRINPGIQQALVPRNGWKCSESKQLRNDIMYAYKALKDASKGGCDANSFIHTRPEFDVKLLKTLDIFQYSLATYPSSLTGTNRVSDSSCHRKAVHDMTLSILTFSFAQPTSLNQARGRCTRSTASPVDYPWAHGIHCTLYQRTETLYQTAFTSSSNDRWMKTLTPCAGIDWTKGIRQIHQRYWSWHLGVRPASNQNIQEVELEPNTWRKIQLCASSSCFIVFVISQK